MRVEVSYIDLDGSPDQDHHEAPRIRIKTWNRRGRGSGSRALVKLLTEEGKLLESHHYAHVSRIRRYC